jgi:hypothetical protein
MQNRIKHMSKMQNRIAYQSIAALGTKVNECAERAMASDIP